MKKYLYSFLTLFTVLFLFTFSTEKASAKDVTNEDLETLAQQYNLTDVKLINEQQENDSTLNFSSIEEFEEFLKNEEKQEVGAEQSSPMMFAAAASKAGTKTYETSEFTGVSTITAYAKVTRDSKGIVTKVVVWSSQTGVGFPIAYTQNNTDYVLNKSKTGGTAYVYGTKAYGATIGGQGIAYKKDVTYKVSF